MTSTMDLADTALRAAKDRAVAASIWSDRSEKIKEYAVASDEARAELHQRIKELEADAARWRHMRSNATFQDRNGPGLYWYLPRWNRELEVGERLDSAIDRAMSEAALDKMRQISEELKLP